MTRLRRFVPTSLIPVSLLTAAAVLLPQAALAHDELVSTDPADGTSLQEGPDELTLTFSGQIAEVGAAVAVTDAAGTSVVEDEPEVDGVTVVQDLADDLAAGDYEAVWRVTSQDGHPISGTFGFVVETGPSDDDSTEGTTGEASPDATGTAGDDTNDATDDATTDTPATQGGQDTQDDATAADEASGVPAWAWLVVGLGVAGLGALLVRTWSRNRP